MITPRFAFLNLFLNKRVCVFILISCAFARICIRYLIAFTANINCLGVLQFGHIGRENDLRAEAYCERNYVALAFVAGAA